MPFTKIMTSFLFDIVSSDLKTVNIFEVLAFLTLTSYANYSNKLKMLILIFDFRGVSSLDIDELVFLFKCAARSYFRYTESEVPNY